MRPNFWRFPSNCALRWSEARGSIETEEDGGRLWLFDEFCSRWSSMEQQMAMTCSLSRCVSILNDLTTGNWISFNRLLMDFRRICELNQLAQSDRGGNSVHWSRMSSRSSLPRSQVCSHVRIINHVTNYIPPAALSQTTRRWRAKTLDDALNIHSPLWPLSLYGSISDISVAC